MSTFQTLRKDLRFSIDAIDLVLYFYVACCVLMADVVSLSFNPKPAAQADRRSADLLRTSLGQDFDVTDAHVCSGFVHRSE